MEPHDPFRQTNSLIRRLRSGQSVVEDVFHLDGVFCPRSPGSSSQETSFPKISKAMTGKPYVTRGWY